MKTEYRVLIVVLGQCDRDELHEWTDEERIAYVNDMKEQLQTTNECHDEETQSWHYNGVMSFFSVRVV